MDTKDFTDNQNDLLSGETEGQQETDLLGNNQEKQKHEDNDRSNESNQKKQDKDHTQLIEHESDEEKEEIIDPIIELSKNLNPMPFFAVLEKYNLDEKLQDGSPLLSQLTNKFLPLTLIPEEKIVFTPDQDGRTPLHYAVEVDDIQAVSWCLNKGAKNTQDNFGNTPIMDAVRLGYKRSFLTCLHFQHYDQLLPHVCAKYNRLWELKVLQALKLNILNSKDNRDYTPLEVAVQNYSYECIQYLTMVSPAVSLSRLRTLTDSNIVINMIKAVKIRENIFSKKILPILSIFTWIAFFFISFNWISYFDKLKETKTQQLIFIIVLYFLMTIISIICKISQKTPQNILSLLRHPYFPPIDDICPSCLNFQNPKQMDHCFDCNRCVEKFHFHAFTCINKSNEMLWFILEFYWLYFLWLMIDEFVAFSIVREMSLGDDYALFNFLRAVGLEYQSGNILLAGFMTITVFALLQQFFFCLQLVGMMVTHRTYQQITQSEKYPHLYYPYKDSIDNKIKLREYRIFQKYRIWGFFVAVKNAVTYFL